MSKELFWLTLTTAMTGLFWVPYILDRVASRGLMGAMGYPGPDDKPQAAWAVRQMKAHANAVENLVIFAPLVLIVHSLTLWSPTTLLACQAYFWARLVHYVVCTLGIPVVRTLAFFVGFLAQAALVLVIFRIL
jgi:uncharacterized MAPEG superfamily protein